MARIVALIWMLLTVFHLTYALELMTLKASITDKTMGLLQGYRSITVQLVRTPNMQTIWSESVSNVLFKDGMMEVDLGRNTVLSSNMFQYPDLAFQVAVSGYAGRVEVPFSRIFSAYYARLSDRVGSVSANAIAGNIMQTSIQGNYTSIQGVGRLQTPLLVSADVRLSTMYVSKKNGRVGIGIGQALPSSPLQVSGSIQLSGFVFADDTFLQSRKTLDLSPLKRD